MGRTGLLLEAAEKEERGADGIVGEGNKVRPAPWLGDVKKIQTSRNSPNVKLVDLDFSRNGHR